MRISQPIENKNFIGREVELEKLNQLTNKNDASILITYGRRRIGKTELLEQAFRTRNLMKFEGIEGESQEYQRKIVMQQLADYANEPLLREIPTSNWIDVFKKIYHYTQRGEWTIYFEEVQWLASYQTQFVSELKYMWDNFWRRNPKIILILCGSAPSFMINQVAHSKALYNRSQSELHVQEFNLIEAKQILHKTSLREVMDAMLMVGGIPAYLLHLKQNSSIFLSMCEHSFQKVGYFSTEYARIFISSLATNPNYQKIIEYLSKKQFASREDILKHLKEKSGGRISELLHELEFCHFIEKYTPVNLGANSKLTRYCIRDEYLQFYFKFIHPLKKEIAQGVFDKQPTRAIHSDTLYKWLGYSFERFCRRYHYVIANILRFGAVRYRSGAFFNRQSVKENSNFQIDLVFDREDNVITICEIKYQLQPVSKSVVSEFERKLSYYPNPKHKQIHKVLIASSGAVDSVMASGYFDNIITLEDLFSETHWR